MKAFPITNGLDENNGMDLRDYFAGQALIGMQYHIKPYNDTKSTAENCYIMADAMMRARK
jgi:hypothetical protein